MIYCSIDVDDYDYKKDSYLLEGWGFTEKSEPVNVHVYMDKGEEIPFEVVRKNRPDVQQSFPDRPQISNCGFQIRVPNASHLMKQYQSFVITIVNEEKEKKVFRKSTQEVIDTCFKKVMLYQVDVCEIHGKNLVLQGWVLDRSGSDEVLVEDEKGRILEGESYRLQRDDVNPTIWIEDADPNVNKAGYNIRIPLKNILTNHVYLVFQNGFVYKKVEIDAKTMQFEISKEGRLWNAIKPEKWQENKAIIKKDGMRAWVEQIKKEVNPQYSNYDAWIRLRELKKEELEEQRKKSREFTYQPVISIIIPLYNTPIRYLKEIVDSIVGQTYENWQLCLADGSTTSKVENCIRKRYGKDSRILYKKLEKNTGISGNTNEALKLATGDFILLADHDDVIVPQALYEIVKVLNERPETDIIYTDEDKISMDGKFYFGPNFKSDFSIDLLQSLNYICHIFTVRKTIVDQIGGFRSEYDGAQDYDFILRCCEKSDKIYHIPQILYHWRAHPDSTAEDPESKRYAYDAGKHAIQEHYRRSEIDATVEDSKYFGIYRSRFAVKGSPKISILILNKDHIDDLDKCITSILEKSTYQNYEIIVAENNSVEESTFQYYEQIIKRDSRVKIVYWKGEFNYSAINNFAAGYATGEYYLLLNNDIEVISEDWLEEMLGYCQREDVGIVGAKLYYPDHSIQHAGVVLGMGGIAGHILCKAHGDEPGYNGRLVTVQDMTAVTAACMMVKKSVYQEVGGLDETFKVAFNDIDFCMKVRKNGKLVVFTPYAEMYHYESKSRGLEDTPEKQMRFAGEIKRFQDKWSWELEQGDPYYNPNLSLQEGDCSLR